LLQLETSDATLGPGADRHSRKHTEQIGKFTKKLPRTMGLHFILLAVNILGEQHVAFQEHEKARSLSLTHKPLTKPKSYVGCLHRKMLSLFRR
jgi:hypothetical protein